MIKTVFVLHGGLKCKRRTSESSMVPLLAHLKYNINQTYIIHYVIVNKPKIENVTLEKVHIRCINKIYCSFFNKRAMVMPYNLRFSSYLIQKSIMCTIH